MAPVPFNVICLRYHPPEVSDEKKLNELNERLLSKSQHSGEFFLTHTKLNGKFVIRVVLGNTNVEQRHADAVWNHLQELSQTLTSHK